MNWRATHVSPDRSLASLALGAALRGLLAGIAFGIIMAFGSGNAVVKGFVFGVIMTVAFFAMMLYIRSRATKTAGSSPGNV